MSGNGSSDKTIEAIVDVVKMLVVISFSTESKIYLSGISEDC